MFFLGAPPLRHPLWKAGRDRVRKVFEFVGATSGVESPPGRGIPCQNKPNPHGQKKQGRQTRTPSMRKVREPTGLTGHFSVSGSASRPCRIAQGQGCESHGSGHDTKSPLAPPLLQIVFNGISLGDHPVRFSLVKFRPSGCDGCHEWGSKPLMPD